jgi:hypothetical protein
MDINQLILYDYIEKHPEQGAGMGYLAVFMFLLLLATIAWVSWIELKD